MLAYLKMEGLEKIVLGREQIIPGPVLVAKLLMNDYSECACNTWSYGVVVAHRTLNPTTRVRSSV